MSGYGQAEERRMALHDLLDRVLITRGADPEAYRRIFLHYSWLRDWFRERAGWRVARWEDSFRLERVPARILPDRGMEGFKEPLDYACFCWVLWFAATRAGNAQDWFALSELAREVQEVSGGKFTLSSKSHRESFVRALRLCQRLGVLSAYAGSEEYWVRSADQGDPNAEVLYDLAPHAPRLLVPVSEDVLAAVAAGGKMPVSLPVAIPPLQRAWRALLLGPGLWRGDDPDAFSALVSSPSVAEDLAFLGWHLEVGRDHARIWRSATAQGAGGLLVEMGTAPGDDGALHVRYAYHPILMLVGRIREEVAAGRLTPGPRGEVAVTAGDLLDHLVALARDHRSRWGQEMQKMALEQLLETVLRQMRRIGYLRGPDADGWCYLLPEAAGAVGRYVEDPAERLRRYPIAAREYFQMSLVDEEEVGPEQP